MREQLVIRGLFALLVAVIVIQAGVIAGLTRRVERLEFEDVLQEVGPEPATVPSPASPSPMPTPEPVRPLKLKRGGGSARFRNPRQRAVAEVSATLAHLARAQQLHKRRTGYYASATDGLWEGVRGFPNVRVLIVLTEPDAFCIEAAHEEVQGARRRFISITGRIDKGICDDRPLEHQVGPNAPDHYGHYETSDVRLRLKDISKRHPERGWRYDLLFDAKWVGPGEVQAQICAYWFFDARGRAIHSGETLLQHYKHRLRDHELISVFEKTHLDSKRPARVKLDCENRY